MPELTLEAEALARAVEVAHAGGVMTERVQRLIERLVHLAPEGSEPWLMAHRELALFFVATDPWQAALCARRVLAHADDDALAWGTLALAQSLLENYEFAVIAYRKALARDPGNLVCAHNLGHLLDVVFDQPDDAREWLQRASALATPDTRLADEVAASLAHAELRSGNVPAARERLRAVMRSGRASHAHHQLYARVNAAFEDALEQMVANIPREPNERRVKKRRRTRSEG